MAEIAIVSSRKAKLRQLADAGDSRARLALTLAEAPNTFLATVQVGITLVGVLAAAFSGASISDQLAAYLRQFSTLTPYADKIAFGVVVITLTYFTLVIGELLPKRIGLGNPEGVARVLAGSGGASWTDGVGSNAAFVSSPRGVALAGNGDAFVTIDNYPTNVATYISVVTPTGNVSTLVGGSLGGTALE